MATTNPSANLTPGEVKDGEDVPSNLDAARPVIDRVKDAQREDASTISGGDTVIDNTPETAAENERAEAEAEKADDADKADERTKTTKRTTKKD